MIYKGRELSKFEEEIMDFIVRHEMLNVTKPFVYQISIAIDANDRAVVKALKKIYGEYPKQLIVTERHKELFDAFEEGMTTTDLANKLDVTRNLINNHRKELEYLGAKFKEHGRIASKKVKKPKRPYHTLKCKDERIIGVRVVKGEYSGMLGYLNDELKVVIHVSGVPKYLEMESYEYEEIR